MKSAKKPEKLRVTVKPDGPFTAADMVDLRDEVLARRMCDDPFGDVLARALGERNRLKRKVQRTERKVTVLEAEIEGLAEDAAGIDI
jgi:hypothetical protein